MLIVVFTYFYTAVQFNPVDQADNLRKYGGYIPGIRPGPPTAQYLDRVLTRLTLPGRALPRRDRGAAEPLHPLRRLLAGDLPRARRHLGADRRRRRARHDAADGVADDDALLRGLPAASEPAAARPAGVGQGHAGERGSPPSTASRTSRPATCSARAIAADTDARTRGRADPRRGRARPGRAHDRAHRGAPRRGRRAGGLRARRLPAHARPGGGARRAARARSGATSTPCSSSTLPDDVARERALGRARRGGPRRRHARGDRPAARDLPRRTPSRSSSTTARPASSCRCTPGDPSNEVFAEIQAALDQVAAR